MSADAGLAVVSGAGSGLGREIALALGRRGHPLALLGRRMGPLEDVLAESGAAGAAWTCDVRDPAAVTRCVAAAVERFGAPQVVVPAAGTAFIAPIAETSPEAFDAVLETNLRGAFLLARACLPAMAARDRSWFVAVLSVAARRGFPGWSAYCASKWGLAGLIAALREETAGQGISIAAIYPGATATPLWDELPGAWNRASMIPAAEVARAVCFVLDAPAQARVEEIVVAPSSGNQ